MPRHRDAAEARDRVAAASRRRDAAGPVTGSGTAS